MSAIKKQNDPRITQVSRNASLPHEAFHAQSGETRTGWNRFSQLFFSIGAQDAARFGGLPLQITTLYPKSSYARTHFTGRQVFSQFIYLKRRSRCCAFPAFGRSLSADGLRTTKRW